MGENIGKNPKRSFARLLLKETIRPQNLRQNRNGVQMIRRRNKKVVEIIRRSNQK
jgi:hypothetical protein